ncbi:Putative uridine kinase [Galdieria sulphuraria]|nr:Putative uridine kinase [Galdieria sulphuraria]
MIGLVGIPGSGKTTLAVRTAAILNSIKSNTCTVVPMDGFHYPKRSLDEMERPAEAHARRGAPWTFDSHGFVQTIEKLRRSEAVFLPWFDHHKGDPEDGAIFVDETIPIVLVEGNYLLLPDKPWNALSHMLDEIWYLDCDISLAMSRVFERMVNEEWHQERQAFVFLIMIVGMQR